MALWTARHKFFPWGHFLIRWSIGIREFFPFVQSFTGTDFKPQIIRLIAYSVLFAFVIGPFAASNFSVIRWPWGGMICFSHSLFMHSWGSTTFGTRRNGCESRQSMWLIRSSSMMISMRIQNSVGQPKLYLAVSQLNYRLSCRLGVKFIYLKVIRGFSWMV